MDPFSLPESFESESQLDEVLTRPDSRVAEVLTAIPGDLAILGVAGKMGLHVAGMAARSLQQAGSSKKVFGVARFSDPGSRRSLERFGVLPIPADLTDRNQVASLPPAGMVIFMAGKKFGTSGQEAVTWAMNTVAPHLAAEHYPGVPTVVYSTGCVYPLVPPGSGGCPEDMPPAPVGDYAQSALGRERIYEWHANKDRTPVCLFRLNYAVEPRYGVLRDLAEKIHQRLPISLEQGHVNLIWQADAVRASLLALGRAAVPAVPMNVTGLEILSVRRLAEDLGRHLGLAPIFGGEEGPRAFLSDARNAAACWGPPPVPIHDVVRVTAQWLKQGHRSLGKPTHFEEAKGRY